MSSSPLVHRGVVKILKKDWGDQKNLGESGSLSFKDLTEKSVNFSPLATSNISTLYNVRAVPWGCSVPWGIS